MKRHLADWIINYSDAANAWRAVRRDDYMQLFNGGPNRISSKSLETLIEILSKTNGDKTKLKNLIK